jgi:hypothetical protein
VKSKPNFALFIPAAAVGLAVTALVVLAAHAHGKRRERRAWLRERTP